MEHVDIRKVIVVEGLSDKKKVMPLVIEPIEIICTNGTVGDQKMEDLIDEYELDEKNVYILADADYAGEKLRSQFKMELPNAEHIYIDKVFKEVATTPEYNLAVALLGKNIQVDPRYLIK